MAKTTPTLLERDGPEAYINHETTYNYYSEPKEGKRRCTRSIIPILLCVFSAILCIAAVIMLCLVFAAIDRSHKTHMNQTASAEFPEICTDCMKILKNPLNPTENDPLMDKLVKRMDDGIQKCCARSSDQLSALLEMMNRKQKTRPVVAAQFQNDDQLKFTPVSAHKHLHAAKWDKDKESRFPERDHIILQFEPNYNDHLMEHARGVEVLQDAIQIKYTGLYYVYSAVNFQPNFNLSTLNQNQMTWYHYVHRTSANSPTHTGILLKTAHSASLPRTAETTYTGGVFHLRATDRIQVCLSGFGVVNFNKESNFLGLFMLGSGEEEMQNQ